MPSDRECLSAGDEQKLSPVVMKPVEDLIPAKVNDLLYRPIQDDDPDLIAMAKSLDRDGVIVPLVITLDGVLLSGHRRRAAAIRAGIESVPVQVYPILSSDRDFLRVLRTCNFQRVKSLEEQVRESIIDADPVKASLEIKAYQVIRDIKNMRRVNGVGLAAIDVKAARRRDGISKGKHPMLNAIFRVVEDNREYWPMSCRQIHYRLLNLAPLLHAGKPDSTYRNDKKCYKNLCDLLTRARVKSILPWECISDETRPATQWRSWAHFGEFFTEQAKDFLSGYSRDPLQSQPAYIEILVEKLTAATPIERAASQYNIPFCVGRGYPSIDAVNELAKRFKKSGKHRFILLVASDFDPEGENIAETLCASLKDEFGIKNITPFKIALTQDQVREFNLPAGMQAKDTSSRRDAFVKKYGPDVYELEAIEPATLQRITLEAIEKVLDLDRYRQEMAVEEKELAELVARRKVLLDAIGGMK